MEDDLAYFCPRLRWAEENNEDSAWIHVQNKLHKIDLKVLAVLKTGPKSRRDIEKELGLPRQAVINHIKRLRRRGVTFEVERPTYKSVRIYHLLSCPARLLS